MDNTVFGLDVVGELDEDDQPLSAVVIVKVLNEDGVAYLAKATDNLTGVEAMGMLEWGKMKMEFAFRDAWESDGAEE